jgi:hypothetical protein
MSSKKKLLTELCLKQRKHNNDKYHLEINDLTRFLKYVNVSIFNSDECILWSGYLTKCNSNKSCYVNYYLNGRKLALHRILYINFIGDLEEKQYLKYSCDNPGQCCNIQHFCKVSNEDPVIPAIEDTTVRPLTSNVVIRKVNNPLSPRRRIVIVFKD